MAVPHWLSTRGRISRGELWLRFVLPLGGTQAVAMAFDRPVWETSWGTLTLSGLVAILLFWPTAIGIVRRLHDLGHSGWLAPFLAGGTGVGAPIMVTAASEIGPDIVILALPVLTLLLGVLWFGFRIAFVRGNRGRNRHGPDPLESSGVYRRLA